MSSAPNQPGRAMPNSSLYNIVLLNDDETPMEFVVHVLTELLDLGYEDACKLMLRVHHEEKAVCGTFERERAEATAAGILAFAGEHNHPLKCVVEEAL